MRLGPLTLTSNLFLSPLAGYTNLPFRLTVREIGGLGLATTDLVNARSLIEKKSQGAQAHRDLPGRPAPGGAALWLRARGDARRGGYCWSRSASRRWTSTWAVPVRKVCRVGGGSAMMTELDKTAALVRGMVEAVKIPVTAKMRLGWDDENITAPDLARALETAGVAAIFVHGRTRQQGFGGRVNLAGIRAVVQAVRLVPVIGNGDITTPQAAKAMLDQTGCAGVSIGRGAFYNPWIFHHTRHYLDTGELLPEPSFDERVRVMCRHLDLMIEVFGEEHGLPHVPQGGALVFPAVRPGQGVQSSRGAGVQPGGVP